MIASLPMYWRDETAHAWNGFWADVQGAWRDHGYGTQLPPLTAPEMLPENWTKHWLDPDLILSQTCSLPFRTALRDQVTYVGTFDFGLDAPDMPCPPGFYQSVYVRHPDAPKDRLPNPTRFAVNSFDSQSGWAVTYPARPGRLAHLQPDIRFLETGAHAASMAAVADGRADRAALDEVTWRLLQRHDPVAQRVIDWGRSPATPGLPLITAKGRDPAPLRAALAQACETSQWMGHPDLGGLQGFVVLDQNAYLQLPVPDMPAQSAII